MVSGFDYLLFSKIYFTIFSLNFHKIIEILPYTSTLSGRNGARLTLGLGLAVSAFPLSVRV
jgi:hypothetical protein